MLFSVDGGRGAFMGEGGEPGLIAAACTERTDTAQMHRKRKEKQAFSFCPEDALNGIYSGFPFLLLMTACTS